MGHDLVILDKTGFDVVWSTAVTIMPSTLFLPSSLHSSLDIITSNVFASTPGLTLYPSHIHGSSTVYVLYGKRLLWLWIINLIMKILMIWKLLRLIHTLFAAWIFSETIPMHCFHPGLAESTMWWCFKDIHKTFTDKIPKKKNLSFLSLDLQHIFFFRFHLCQYYYRTLWLPIYLRSYKQKLTKVCKLAG